MAGIIIKPRSRIFHGHDWVYSSEIQKTFGDPEPGDVVSLKDFRDKPLGTAVYNPNSQIAARRISRRKQKLDYDFFERRIQQAIDMREESTIEDTKLCRLVWAESDAIPGLVVDRYGDILVLQILTLAMYQRKDLIVEALVKLQEPKAIILRNDSPLLQAEGMDCEVELVYGGNPGPFTVECNGVTFELDLLDSKKGGLSLDQLDSQDQLAKLAKGKKVLSVFSGHGGFAIACAKAGATNVTAIDNCDTSIETIHRNAELNDVEVNAINADGFNFLKNCKETYDLIILDPPSFTSNKKTLKDAIRNYKELHIRSLELLEKNGQLSTFTSSNHITRELYLDNVLSASVDAKRSLKLVSSHTQCADHPIMLGMQETECLKGFTFQVVASR